MNDEEFIKKFTNLNSEDFMKILENETPKIVEKLELENKGKSWGK